MSRGRCTKGPLLDDLREICVKAHKEGYSFGPTDIFALGYMVAKYDLKKLLNNQEEVIEACRKYDEKDDLMLLDTIGETLIDLDIIKNDGRI